MPIRVVRIIHLQLLILENRPVINIVRLQRLVFPSFYKYQLFSVHNQRQIKTKHLSDIVFDTSNYIPKYMKCISLQKQGVYCWTDQGQFSQKKIKII